MRTSPVLAGSIAALISAPLVLPGILYGTDSPIPAGHEAAVDSARASLLRNVDGAFGLRFVELACTAGGGALVVFEVRGPLSEGGLMTALNDDAMDPTGWWGGLSSPEDLDAVAFLADHPRVGCV